MAQTFTAAQVNEAVRLIQQHETEIKQFVMNSSSWASPSANQPMSTDAKQRLSEILPSLTQDQVEQVATVLPIYRLGYQSGQSGQSSQSGQSGQSSRS